MTKATATQVRAAYKSKGYEVRISKDGRVTFKGPRWGDYWREGRFVEEYKVIDGQVVLL